MEQEDDFFDDADLDELERNAIASTQHPSTAALDPATTASDFDFEDEDVIDLDARDAAPIFQNQPPQTAGKPDEVTAREQWRHQRFAQTTPGLNRAAGFHSASRRPLRDPKPASVPYRNSSSQQHTNTQSDKSLEVLQARIQELENERIRLQQAAEDAKSSALAKAGEIAIVRSNHDRASKEHDRKVAALQKQHAEELAKQKSELDVVRRDREKAETDKRFLEHDLAQEAQKSKRNVPTRTLKEGHGNVRKPAQDSPATTPRKNRMLPLRDGFNDDEIMVISPSKASRSKPSTPSKAGAKRKRPQNSPVQPLELDDGDAMQGVEGSFASRTEDVELGLPLRLRKDPAEERYKFLQYILNHRSEGSETRTVEKFTAMKIPSTSSKTLASLVYEHFTTNQQNDLFREDFCQFLLELWDQCLQESHHAPLFYLNRLLMDILTESPPEVSTAVIVPMVQRCQTTADLVALPTVKHSKTPAMNKAPPPELKSLVDPYDQLELLMVTALNISEREDALAAFWQTMEFEIVLLLLNKAHPIAQITLMLQLLETSILTTSFGTITSQSQQQHETDMLDRLTVLLFEQPTAPPDEPAYSGTELLTLRRTVLALLKALCLTAHGGRALAVHKLVIGRLVRFLHEAVVAMYEYRAATHALTSALVNDAVRLLAHLTAVHADAVDMRARLAVVPSGAQMHLVSLSRIAFSESESGLEKLVAPDVAEAAHRMLDEHLSPEEGEAVVEVFSSAKA